MEAAEKQHLRRFLLIALTSLRFSEMQREEPPLYALVYNMDIWILAKGMHV